MKKVLLAILVLMAAVFTNACCGSCQGMIGSGGPFGVCLYEVTYVDCDGNYQTTHSGRTADIARCNSITSIRPVGLNCN